MTRIRASSCRRERQPGKYSNYLPGTGWFSHPATRPRAAGGARKPLASKCGIRQACGMAWTLTRELDEFVAAAGDQLRSDPVLHTVPLTLLETLRRRGPSAFGDHPPVYGWHKSAD